LVPSLDDLAAAKGEGEGLTAGTGGIEGSAVEESARIVYVDLVSFLAGTLAGVRELVFGFQLGGGDEREGSEGGDGGKKMHLWGVC
jgi:hypothetical protein